MERGGKWELPGWRIEQKYCQGVLIGNWSEDRLGKVRTYSLDCTITTYPLCPLYMRYYFIVSQRQGVWEQHFS